MSIKINKPKRLGRGSWEKNGSLYESEYYLKAALAATIVDPTAVRHGRPFNSEDIDKVVAALKVWYPGEPFTREKVALYVNASATNNAIINKDKRVARTQSYYTQLDQYRKGLAKLTK